MTELEWMDIFRDNLVELMQDARKNQKELAEDTGLSEATISNYANKRQMPSIKAIINLSYALDCEVSVLIDFGDRIE